MYTTAYKDSVNERYLITCLVVKYQKMRNKEHRWPLIFEQIFEEYKINFKINLAFLEVRYFRNWQLMHYNHNLSSSRNKYIV